MSSIEEAKKNAEEAMHKLVLAMIKRDEREITKWKEQADYWTEVAHDLELRDSIFVSKTDIARLAAKKNGVEVVEHKLAVDPFVDYSITQKIEYLIGHGYGSGEEFLDYLESRGVESDVASTIVNTFRELVLAIEKEE